MSLELDALRVTYPEAPAAVDELDLRVASGGWTAIVGPNGAGKSSVLRAIAGLVSYRGTVRIDGVDGATVRARERARLVALVPQAPVLPAETTVADYVLLGRSPHVGALAAESDTDRDKAAAAMRDLGVARFSARPLSSLSGGEAQRAVLARAIAQHAPVLLLDEPTTFLDIGHQIEALELVDALRLREGITVLSVMHDLTLASQFAEELVLLAGGRAVASGPASTVLTEASIREHYGARVRVLHDAGRLAVMPTRARREPPTERPVRPAIRERASSLVLVNTGDGKGKTTAAVGVAQRAVARGWRVCVVQFLKSGKWKPGEQALEGVEWWATGDGFTWDSENLDHSQALAAAAWDAARSKIASGDYHLVVLDEVTYPMNWGWIATDDVVTAIRSRPAHVNVVATGRDAPEPLVEIADTVTEMRSVKHAFDRGVPAMRGIDF